jgi:SPP1 family holin
MDKASITRIALLIISLANLLLESLGYAHIPEFLGELTAEIILALVSLYTAWKNNYLSKKGKAQKQVLEKNGLK